MPKIPPHIFVKTLEEAQRLAPNAKLVKDESGSDIPCHPYEVCLCETTDPQIVEHDRKAEIIRLIRGDYYLLLLGDSPEAMEKREKYGLKVRTEPIDVQLSPSMTTDDLLGLSGRSKVSYIDPFAFNPVGGDDIGTAPVLQKGRSKPMTPEEMRTSSEPNIRMAFDPDDRSAYPPYPGQYVPHLFPTLDRMTESVHTDVPKAGYLKQPDVLEPMTDVNSRATFPLRGWPERPRMAMSGRPLVLRSDDPLAEELKKRHGLGKESTEASTPDVPPVGVPKDRFLDFLRHAAASMDPSLPVDHFYVGVIADHMDALAQVDASGDQRELQILKAQQNDPNYLRQAQLPTPEGEDDKNEERRRFADVGVIADYMRAGGKGDEFYHFHTAHENTKPTEKPKGRVERMIFSINSVGGPVQDFMDPPAQPANPLPGPTDPGPEEILVGQVNGEPVWDSVFGDVAPSPDQSTPDSKPIEAIHLLSGESFSAARLLTIGMSRSTGPLARMSVEGQILERTKWGTGEWGIGIDHGDSAGSQPLVFTVPETLKSKGEPDDQS